MSGAIDVEARLTALEWENKKLSDGLLLANDKIFQLEKFVRKLRRLTEEVVDDDDDDDDAREVYEIELKERRKWIGGREFYVPLQKRPRLEKDKIPKEALEAGHEFFHGCGNTVLMKPDHSELKQQQRIITGCNEKYKNYSGGWYKGALTGRNILLGQDHATLLDYEDIDAIETSQDCESLA